ncbi:hypothetical protein TNCV_4919811 [Trichonephila clavipes]|nr:hypothetical protein TNCV_4919811 [Trichonephila clavipes]
MPYNLVLSLFDMRNPNFVISRETTSVTSNFHASQGIFWAIPQHLNDTDCSHRTQPSSVDAFHGRQLPPALKIESFLVISSYSPEYSVMDDNMCDHLFFGVKPHCRRETSKVAQASVYLY